MQKKLNKTHSLAESAIMLALSIALFAVSDAIPWPYAYGGGFSLFGQVPIIIVSYRHGLKYGLIASTGLALFEMMMGFKNFSYVSGLVAWFIVAFADYIIAFGCLGLGGIFKNKIKNQTAALVTGGLIVCFIRFLCHFVSGVTIWSGYAPENMLVGVYSLVYNGSYMLIETIITVIGLIAVSTAFNFRKKNLA
ncbi:MAG: energy-coupled thiamine transporter ThiT [Clostridia bacterium]|nr:energy-coupled thiamine transporter ThiT [Clostridia bacterium]